MNSSLDDAVRALGWYRQFCKIVLMFVISNIEHFVNHSNRDSASIQHGRNNRTDFRKQLVDEYRLAYNLMIKNAPPNSYVHVLTTLGVYQSIYSTTCIADIINGPIDITQ